MKQDNTRPRTAEDVVIRYRTLLKEADNLQADLEGIQKRIAEINAILSTLKIEFVLSTTSNNPVANKTITQAINTLAGTIPSVINTFDSESETDALSALKGKELYDLIQGLDERVTALEGR